MITQTARYYDDDDDDNNNNNNNNNFPLYYILFLKNSLEFHLGEIIPILSI